MYQKDNTFLTVGKQKMFDCLFFKHSGQSTYVIVSILATVMKEALHYTCSTKGGGQNVCFLKNVFLA